MRNPLIFAALFIIFAVLGSMFGPHGAGALGYNRGFAVYYNDMKDSTVIQFRQSTSETSAYFSENWLVRNPNASGGASIVFTTSGNTGITIPPGQTFSGTDYRNAVTIYCATSTAVELWFETNLTQ